MDPHSSTGSGTANKAIVIDYKFMFVLIFAQCPIDRCCDDASVDDLENTRDEDTSDEGFSLPVEAIQQYANQDYAICRICAQIAEYVAAQALD